jgi:hypothetical protein
MKTLLSFTIVALCLIATSTYAQKQYTVDGQQYDLFTEIDGSLSLLWNTVDGEYRYFSKKGSVISELKNTKVDGKYQEEFKATLREQSSDANISVDKVKFTRPGLSSFFVAYNKATDPNFVHETKSVKLKTRLGVFGGVTNNIFSDNPTNAISPTAGIDFEVVDEVMLKRHSVVLRFKQYFENSDTKSSSSQFSLNYRFKFVKSPKFDVFINTKFVAYTYSNREFTTVTPGPADVPIVTTTKTSGGNLNAPAAFGLGADYAVGNGYITFCYNDIVALGVDSNKEFPVDFTLGYKLNL